MPHNHLGVEAIRTHYDRVSPYYRAFWGEHIHHGYWENGESPAVAQVKLVERLDARARIPYGAHILDVGCGLGAQRYGWHVTSTAGCWASPLALCRWRWPGSGRVPRAWQSGSASRPWRPTG